MTRRVIQTDLFTAFQESQRRAEEQLGHKRAIRIEGSAVRRDEEPTVAPQVRHMHGFEVISSPSASAVLLGTPATAGPELGVEPTASVTTPLPADSMAIVAHGSSRERVASTASHDRVKVEAASTVQADNVIRTVQSIPVVADASSPLLKIAGVAFAITAAFVVGRSTSEPEVREVKIYVPAQVTNTTATTVAATTNASQESAARVEAPVVELPKSGKYTVLLVSGISKKQAEKLAAQIKKDSGFDAFVNGSSVYVGRFEKAFNEDINKVEKFCREYKFEGRAQFADALQVPIPGTR